MLLNLPLSISNHMLAVKHTLSLCYSLSSFPGTEILESFFVDEPDIAHLLRPYSSPLAEFSDGLFAYREPLRRFFDTDIPFWHSAIIVRLLFG